MNIQKYLELNERNVVTCCPEDSVQKIASMLGGKNACALPVCDTEGRMIGIVSERDVVRTLGEKGGDTLELCARDLMTTSVTICSPEDSMNRVRQIMYSKGFRNVPVLDGDTILGVIGSRDALKTRLEEKELEVNVLKDIVITTRGN